ncbi:MAG: four-carbon acid sugar kinase family protein [Deltaproteobacteria bacterium]|nr:four-carbon acid sugar kinase family protein [Deltaproteobacteria bacterium]
MRDSRKLSLLLSFYGDDFTGTAATAEALTVSGVPTLVFVEPPTVSFLQDRFPKLQAVGVAGMSRSLPTEALEATLEPIFQRMKRYRAPLFLYKVCSTFDSSPELGSIGRAIEIGKKVFSPRFIPILPAAPRFGRYTVFGHHFVALGGDVLRLDRHPSLSLHPATPMRESDLRRHLAKQTTLKSDLISILTLEKGKKQVGERVQDALDHRVPLVFFDSLLNRHLKTACSVIWGYTEKGKTLFVAGSQELGYGLAEEWKRLDLLDRTAIPGSGLKGRKAEQVLVVSGSCASVTGRQIEWAAVHGFEEIGIHPERLFEHEGHEAELQSIATAAVSALRRGTSVVIHSAVGPEDPRIFRTKEKAESLGLGSQAIIDGLGRALGSLARTILSRSGVRRLVLVGGDVSGVVSHALGIIALQVVKPVGIAAPLCFAYSSRAEFNGLQVALKGGQVGEYDYFTAVRSTRMPDFERVVLGDHRKSED